MNSGSQDSSAAPRRSRRLQLAQGRHLTRSQASVGLARINRNRPTAISSNTVRNQDLGGTPKDTVGESVSEDDLCPICQLLLYRPVVTQCNHTLCESCMAHWAEVCISTQMTIVDVDEEALNFDPVIGLEANCPMCRTQTSATLDPQRSAQLETNYPHTWRERELEHQDLRETGEGVVQTLIVYIGNRHRLVTPTPEDSNMHEWTFFLKPSLQSVIEEVQILLHPTFHPDRVIRTRPPYQIRRLGWGQFTVVACVILKAGYSWVSEDAEDSPDGAPKGVLPLEWRLDFDSFDGRGSMGRCRLKVKNDREWEGTSNEGDRDAAELQRVVRQYQRDGRYEPEGED